MLENRRFKGSSLISRFGFILPFPFERHYPKSECGASYRSEQI
jgi:hypothetical protein